MTPTTPSPISDQAADERAAFEAWADKAIGAGKGKTSAWMRRVAEDAWQARGALSTAPTTGSAPIAVKAFGTGAQVVIEGTFDGEYAVMILPAKQPGDVGASAKREGPITDDSLVDAVVLTFPTAEQVERVANALVAAPASPAASVLTYAEAQQIVSCAKLRKDNAYIRPYPAEGKVVIEGSFSPEELEAIAFMLRSNRADRAAKQASDEVAALLAASIGGEPK